MTNVHNTPSPLQSIYRPPSYLLRDIAKPASYKFQVVKNNTSSESSSAYLEAQLEHSQETIRIPGVWLRDHCGCDECVDGATQQRMLDIFAGPSGAVSHRVASHTSTTDNDGIEIEWTDGHRSRYTYAALARAWSNPETILEERQGRVPACFWDRSIGASPPAVPFSSIMESEAGLGQWLYTIRKYGFCFVPGTPATAAATEALLERIGPIRNTHYGAFWEFTADLAKADTAYTNVALDMHNDSTYFSDPSGLQMFHLLAHTDGTGGASQFVDGFRVAQALWEHDRAAYDALAHMKLLAHSSGNAGISIQPQAAFPVLEHDLETGLLKRIRWNNSDRCTLIPRHRRGPGVTNSRGLQVSGEGGGVSGRVEPSNSGSELPEDEDAGSAVEKWYRSAAKLVALLRSEESQYEFQMQPGNPVIFDNWRVLHGRSAFTGKRTLCGGYINMDDFISRYRTSNFGHENVLRDGVY